VLIGITKKKHIMINLLWIIGHSCYLDWSSSLSYS